MQEKLSNVSKLLRCMMNAEFFCYAVQGCLYSTKYTVGHPAGVCITQLIRASVANIHECLDTSAIKLYPVLGGVLGIPCLGAISPLVPLSEELSCTRMHMLS
jgi:hypothetical protein